MGSWPLEGVPVPMPEKPEGITDHEWAWYLNSDPNRKPELRDKVEAALGWKAEDTADAQEIAETVLGAVRKLDEGPPLKPAAGKGHVPEENLERYRYRAGIAHLLSRLGNMVSGLGEHEDANKLWALGGKYKRMANDLRVDLPRKEDKNDHHD